MCIRDRAAYRPAYRVLHRTYVRLLPLLAAIDRALAENPRVLLAIDGGAASGKSTLADLLTAIYPDTALFHADDFFLRPEQRTAARYAQPGGNLDRERLESEILAPISRNEVAIYRPFDCHTPVSYTHLLSTIIGHVTSATTLNVYAHVTDTMRENAAASIDRGIAGIEPPRRASSPAKPKVAKTDFQPVKRKYRKPGTG